MEDNSFEHYFNEHFYTKLHGLLNFPLLFEFHYKGCNFLNHRLAQFMLHWALIAYIFLETSWISSNANPWFILRFFIRIMLIRISGSKNNSCIFYSYLKFLHFHFLSVDGGATTWTIYMCNLSSSFYRWDLVGRLSLETACSPSSVSSFEEARIGEEL